MSKALTSAFRILLFRIAIAALIGGCGGAVDTGEKSAAGGSTSNPPSGAGGSACCGNSPDQKLLGDCKPGFTWGDATDSRPCRFFVGQTCYATQDEACACACPRNQGPVICVADGNQYLAGTDAYGVWCEPE